VTGGIELTYPYGMSINKVVFRATEPLRALQQMHDPGDRGPHAVAA